MLKKVFKTLIASPVLLLSGISSVFAAGEEGPPIFGGEETPEQTGIENIEAALGKTSGVVASGSVRDLVIKYVNFALPYLALAAFLGFVYAGFLYVTAYGNDEQTGKAKKVMTYAVIGIVLVILSYSIVQVFTVQLTEGINK
jgi:hypothetical protein